MIEIATLTIPPIIQIKMLAYNTLTALVKALKQPIEMVAAISHVLSPLKKKKKMAKGFRALRIFQTQLLKPTLLMFKTQYFPTTLCSPVCLYRGALQTDPSTPLADSPVSIQSVPVLWSGSIFSCTFTLLALFPPPPTLHYRHHRKNIEGSLPAYTSYAARLAPTRANGRAR